MKKKSPPGLITGLGLLVGAGLGAAFGNVSFGAGLGLVFGAAIETLFVRSRSDT